jgi:hypothetical protein
MNDRISAARLALAFLLPLALACNGSSDEKKTTGSGKDASVDAGPSAQLKFCNALALQGNGNLRLSLQVGDPPVVMTANSGECSTPTGSPCKLVPVGMVPVRLVDDMAEEVASGTATIKAGEQWIMVATIGANNLPAVKGGTLMAQYMCSTIDPFMVPDGGMMEPPSPDAGAGQ